MRACQALVLLTSVLLAGMAQAALPPQYQNTHDLDAMVAFIKANPAVAGTLRSIDMETYTIHYGKDCRAVFGRKKVPENMPGPAGALVFKSSTCKID